MAHLFSPRFMSWAEPSLPLAQPHAHVPAFALSLYLADSPTRALSHCLPGPTR
jgi:hypothetical protein